MSCNCGERAVALLARLGFKEQNGTHVYGTTKGVIGVSDKTTRTQHVRVSLLAILARILLPR